MLGTSRAEELLIVRQYTSVLRLDKRMIQHYIYNATAFLLKIMPIRHSP